MCKIFDCELTKQARQTSHYLRVAAALCVAALAACSGQGSNSTLPTTSASSPQNAARTASAVGPGVHGTFARVCGAGPTGYNPADLQSAYALPSSTAGSGQTVAIVDAYNDPNAESDLGIYRSQFGLPACTTANGCCNSNLGTAVNEAAKLGANAISNSYGGSESSGESSYDSYYNHPGIAVTVSSGDGGYGVEYPASSQYVTAVGGTRLVKASATRGWSESVWSTSSTEGAGSGCSAYLRIGHRRHVRYGVYDSYSYMGQSGWMVFGGTSVASPIIASVYALAGNASSVTAGSYSYSHTSSLNDVTSGSTASCGSILCTAAAGWDGPTGNGTPSGTGAF